MSKKLILTGLFAVSLILFVNCSDDEETQHMCFYNGSGQTARGVALRPSDMEAEWTYTYFDSPVYTGNGFDYDEGEFNQKIEKGVYDVMVFNNSLSRIRQWNNYSFDGKSIGIQCTNTLSTSLIGAVDKNCAVKGTSYQADL